VQLGEDGRPFKGSSFLSLSGSCLSMSSLKSANKF
jgi:hypothetical protein